MQDQNQKIEDTNNCQTCSALLNKKEDFDLPEDNVLPIDVNVDLINKPHANVNNLQKKEQRVQRTDFVNKLKKYISALRNTGGGIVLVHINGLADEDTCLDYFHELVDVRLNDMIEDGSLFVQSYQKDWLLDTESNSEENKPFKGFVVIHVTGSSIVTTFNFNSKQPLDNCIIDVQSNAVIRFLKRKTCFQHKRTSIRGIPQINERRNIQVKGFHPETLPAGLLQNAATFNDFLWEKCGLAGYVSAFSKLDGGGSFFLGINENETQYPKETYKSKTFTGVGIQFRDLQFRNDTETAILQSLQDNTVIVTYSGAPQNTPRDTIKVAFHPVEADKFVLEVAVAAVDGLLCYDKEGPEAYEFENNKLKRLTIKEWYEGLTPRLKPEMALTEKDSNPRLDENLTHRPVGRVDIRSLYQRRPPCMQIERSLEDIEATVLHAGLETIKTYPTNFPAGEAYVNLKTRLNELPTMENVGLAYIAKSLPATANMDIKYRTPGYVILDICLIRQGSPAVVLSVVTDMPVDMKLAQRYTSAVSKELTKNVRRFTTVTFNSIYGLLREKDLKSQDTFESSLSRIEKERSRLCVPDSLSMNREKYKHVVRAFLSSVAVTTLVSNEKEETLWFLTHKQFCILTQNIDQTEVHVDTCPASGGGVLSLTVAQRLQKLGRTLLISDDPKLVERARKQNIDSKTFNDILQSDPMAEEEDPMNVVIYQVGGPCSSPQLPQLLSSAHRRWVFHRQTGMLADEDGQQRLSLLPEPATVIEYDADTMERIHNLLDASSAEIVMAIKDSFRTSAVDDVIKLLEENNRWITITGLPGEGKTTLGYMVLETMKAKGATVCVIDNPNDYALFTDNAATMHVFLFKDVLSYATCDLEIRKQWIHFINNLHRKIVKGEHVSNVYAVFICNKYDEEWKYFGGYDEEIFHRNLFNLSDHFRETPSERTTILKYFLQKYQIPVQTLVASIACTKHGFLHCCKLFCEWQKTNQKKLSLQFFSDPLFYVMNLVSAHIDDVSTMAFLRNVLQNDRFICTKEVVLPKPLSQMPGVFLQEEKQMLKFSHPSVRMVVALVVGKEDPLFVLQNCNSTFVIPRLKIHTAKGDTGFLYVNIDNPEVLQKVISTFKHALQEGFFDVIGHEMCLEETFCRKLLTDVSNTSSTFLHEVNMDGYSLLHVSLRQGNKVAVRVLLDMKVNVKAKCHGKTVLHILCEDIKFDEHLCLLLLDNGADVSAVDEEGQTILHHLCMLSGNDPAILLVLGKGCDTTVTDKSGKTALHYLCANRHIDKDLVTRLIQSGCDVNMLDKWGKNALHYLCESSVFDQNLFHIIVKHGADVSATDQFGNTALHYAAERTHPLETIDFLIKNGSNINWKTKSGDTVSLLLCKLNKLQGQVFKYLIRHGADLNVADEDGKTILIILAENGTLNPEMLHLLISAGCDVNKQDDLGNTPLHYCCIRGNMDETISLMLRYVTNVNHPNQFLKTPLHYACEHKYIYPQVIKHLILSGADTNAIDLHEMTPLIYLCEKTRTSMDDFPLSLGMLLHGKCDLNKSDKDRKTALHYVCERQKNTEFIIELIRKCEEVNMRDSHGRTPLHYLCMREDLKDLSGMVNMLTQKDSDPNICDEWGRAPLHLLCNRKHIDKDIIRILLTTGANVNVRDVFKKTPLHYACDHTTVNRDAITLLIRGRADVNISDGNERTPLHLLCRQKHIDIEAVKILLKHNALVNNTDEHGNTVLHYVSQNEASTKDIVTLIIEHGADLDKTNGLGVSVSECLLKQTDLKPIVQRAIWKHMPAGSTMQAVEDYNLRFQLPNGAQELFKEIGRTGIIDRKDKHGKTFLHYACAMKYDSIIEKILKLNCNVNLKDSDHMTALHIICKRTDGDIQNIIALLLEHGAEVDMTDRYGHTPLHYLGMTTINAEQNATHLELLLNRGADVIRADGNGIHLVHYLAIAGICDKIQVALDKETRDVDVTVKHDVSTVIHKGQTALHLACISSEAGTGVVRELLKFKANICATDRRGRTPLHYLCLSPCKIAYNANTNELSVEPTTDRKGRKELVELLLAHHMKKKRKQREQRLVVEDSTSDSGLGELSDCPKTTKSASVPVPPAVQNYVNMTDDRGRSAFQYLCSSGTIDNELFQYMISLDPTVKAWLVNKSDYNGITVLHSLVLSGSHLTEKIIGDINNINGTRFDEAKDAFFVIPPGQTALHLACRTINADLKIVQLLLQHKANVNVTDCNDRTPLFYICEDAQNISWDQTSHEFVIKSDSKPSEDLQDIRYNIALALIHVGALKDKPSDDGVQALHGQFRTMFSST